MQYQLEDKLKIWRGYKRLGFWQSTFVRLRDNTLYFSSDADSPPKFQIYIKLLKVRKVASNKFNIHNGISMIFFKAPDRETQKRIKIQESNESEEDYLMGIRTLLHHTPENPHMTTVPDLNKDLLEKLTAGLADAVQARDRLRAEIAALEQRQPGQGTDRQAWGECLASLKRFEAEASGVVNEAEIELREARGFDHTLGQTQILLTERNAPLNDSHDRESLEQQFLTTTKTIDKESQSPGVVVDMNDTHYLRGSINHERNLSSAVTYEADTRRFLNDPEYKDELSDVRKSFQTNQIKGIFLIGNLGLENDVARGSMVLRRSTLSGQTRQSPGISEYVMTNAAFKLYQANESTELRKSLPAFREPAVRLNYWRILKENIGRGLSQLVVPIYLREPLTLNQKAAEMFEYAGLLRSANQERSETLRVAKVASFFIMALGQTKGRVWLPFNSLMGETFDIVQDDLQVVVETVSDRPQTQAIYAESNDFIVQGINQVTAWVSVSGVEFEPKGDFEVMLKATGERYVVRRPRIVLSDYIFGDISFWVSGSLVVSSIGSPRAALVHFKPKGWSTKNDYAFTGKVSDGRGETTATLSGRWDESVTFQEGHGDRPVVLAQIEPRSPSAPSQYNMTAFAINLNHLNMDNARRIPPTDSRWRGDLRAYENGNMEVATFENYRLEHSHDRSSDVVSIPRWFEVTAGPNGPCFTFTNNYFHHRDNKRWPSDLRVLFE